jgi:hypothetical protein
MYSSESLTTDGSIQIPEIEGFAGHVMRRELLMLLRPGVPGVESGVLTVLSEEESRDFAFQPTGANSRTETRNRARYVLRTPEGVIRGAVVGSASFSAPSTPYADITSRREASSKAAVDAAQLLAEDLLLKAGSLQGSASPAGK